MDIIKSIITTLLLLSVLTIVHELGHFGAARLFKVKVNEFALFMGPKIFSWVSKKSGTRYSIRSVPIGGFCAMEGEEETSADDGSFNKKPVYKRSLIIVAGPLMNLLLALVIIIGIFCYTGYDTNVVDTVSPNTLASAQNLEVGDKVIKYDGQQILNYMDYSLFNYVDKDDTTIFTVKKVNGEEQVYTFNRTRNDKNQKSTIGFNFKHEKNVSIFKTMSNSVIYLYSMVKSIFYSLIWLITGKVALNAVAGPIGLTQIIGEVVNAPKAAFLLKFLSLSEFAALISVNLGIFNLLPFPGLDGGRLTLLGVEKIRRKPLKPEREAMISFVGLALLMLLALVVAVSDVLKF